MVGAAAFAAGLELHELARRDVGLEDIFLRLTGDPAPEDDQRSVPPTEGGAK
jgi:ABC-2 type transport system ATP-binding protein